jgi:hypothetical protein
VHFNEKTARLDYLRTMRLLLSMSFYALLEKHMSARYLIGEWCVHEVRPPSDFLQLQGYRLRVGNVQPHK